MKFLLSLLTVLSLNLFAEKQVSETGLEYREAKTKLYQLVKNHSEVFSDSRTTEEKKVLSKSRSKLMKKAIEVSKESKAYWSEFKSTQEKYNESETSETKKAFMKAKKDLEVHIVTDLKNEAELSELYLTWTKAMKKLEAKRLMVLGELDKSSQSSLKSIYKDLQKLR
jgi:hypothetical protein